MAIRIVQSKQNARVKELRSALSRPGKGDAGLVALEGAHLLAEALNSGVRLETIFVAQGFENLLVELGLTGPASNSIEILVVPPELLYSVVTTEAPQPIAALARVRDWHWSDLLAADAQTRPLQASPSLIAVLAGIQDPGNFGTILRSAEAFGASGAVCLPGTVSRWNPKSVRASAGSVFRLPVLTVTEAECFEQLRRAGISTVAAMAHNAQPLGELDLTRPIALFIGAEGSGLTPELAAQCDARITIPCPGPVESLNAAVAAGVLLYEASRQRAAQQSVQEALPKPAKTRRRA
jgi:TrmH family RNA methyltransferase